MCLAYVLVAGTTLVAGFSIQLQSLHNQLSARARNDAAILAAGSIANFSSGNTGTLQEFVSSLLRAQGVSYAVVVDENDRVVASTIRSEVGKMHRLRFVGSPQATVLDNGDVEAIAPVGVNTVAGLASVTVSGASVQSDLRTALFIESSVRVLGLMIFIFLSALIARYILGPISDLVRAARLIRSGQLATRVPVRGETELGTVAEAFNEMTAALERRIASLSFLATTGSALPSAFRDQGDVLPYLREFCERVGGDAAGLLVGEDTDGEDIWYEPEGVDLFMDIRRLNGPMLDVVKGHALMTVAVQGGLFVVARVSKRLFSPEEQQVITSFAFEFGTAADNARLFEAQQEALRLKDQFLSIVSHEFRTPLTTIKGYAQMLRRKVGGDPTAERFADNIDAQISRLSRLVDDLLDATRFTRGHFELVPAPMDLRPVLEEVVSRFELVANGHPIRLELDAGSYEGVWDEDRVEQVLNNLISNAIKYSPEGGEVMVSASHDDGYLVISVSDRGVGIPEKDQSKLFDRFYRGSTGTQDVKGLGLGLFVTRRIVEAHGGTITVRSRPGQGSTFTFTLPLAPVHAGEARA